MRQDHRVRERAHREASGAGRARPRRLAYPPQDGTLRAVLRLPRRRIGVASRRTPQRGTAAETPFNKNLDLEMRQIFPRLPEVDQLEPSTFAASLADQNG